MGFISRQGSGPLGGVLSHIRHGNHLCQVLLQTFPFTRWRRRGSGREVGLTLASAALPLAQCWGSPPPLWHWFSRLIGGFSRGQETMQEVSRELLILPEPLWVVSG